MICAAYPLWLIAGHDPHLLESLPTLVALYAVQTIAVAATIRLGDRQAQARARSYLALAHARLGDFEAAQHHLQQVFTLCDELGDSLGKAHAHSDLGWLLTDQQQPRSALDHYQRALAEFRAAGSRAGQARILNDQELVRAGFRALLDADPGIEVVAEAGDGRTAVELARAHRLDVMLMDIQMPELDGIDATRAIRALTDPPEVLILTTFDTDENAFDALEAGAAGFLVKDTPPGQLLAAVRAAAAGGAVISPATTRRLVDHLVAARLSWERPAPAGLELLTEREREVLALVARGCSNREIAGRLHITELTAKTHVSRILTKLNLDSRVQAAAMAYQVGLVRPGDQ